MSFVISGGSLSFCKMPGYDLRKLHVDFGETSVKRYECSHCNNLPKEPVQLNGCGHWVCYSCVSLAEIDKRLLCPACKGVLPIDDKNLYYHRDKYVQREIDNIPVSCSNCTDWNGTISELEEHLRSCFPITSSPSPCGECGQEIPISKLEAHRESCLKLIRYNGACFEHSSPTECEGLYTEGNHEVDIGRSSLIRSLSYRLLQTSNMIAPVFRRFKEINREYEQKFERFVADKWFRFVYNPNYNGVMQWKIPDYSRRMSDAKKGRYLFNLSPIFYTSKGRYNMCLKLYLNGDGSGLPDHLSIYLIFLDGENDAELQWPFRFRASFRLINVSTGSDVIGLLTNSSERPLSGGMNTSFGFPSFISQSVIENGGFVKDDCLFLKFTINPQ